jgi:hypothetical protein
MRTQVATIRANGGWISAAETHSPIVPDSLPRIEMNHLHQKRRRARLPRNWHPAAAPRAYHRIYPPACSERSGC